MPATNRGCLSLNPGRCRMLPISAIRDRVASPSSRYLCSYHTYFLFLVTPSALDLSTSANSRQTSPCLHLRQTHRSFARNCTLRKPFTLAYPPFTSERVLAKATCNKATVLKTVSLVHSPALPLPIHAENTSKWAPQNRCSSMTAAINIAYQGMSRSTHSPATAAPSTPRTTSTAPRTTSRDPSPHVSRTHSGETQAHQ